MPPAVKEALAYGDTTPDVPAVRIEPRDADVSVAIGPLILPDTVRSPVRWIPELLRIALLKPTVFEEVPRAIIEPCTPVMPREPACTWARAFWSDVMVGDEMDPVTARLLLNEMPPLVNDALTYVEALEVEPTTTSDPWGAVNVVALLRAVIEFCRAVMVGDVSSWYRAVHGRCTEADTALACVAALMVQQLVCAKSQEAAAAVRQVFSLEVTTVACARLLCRHLNQVAVVDLLRLLYGRKCPGTA
jgi:hypothetical protein